MGYSVELVLGTCGCYQSSLVRCDCRYEVLTLRQQLLRSSCFQGHLHHQLLGLFGTQVRKQLQTDLRK